jgi:3-phosphoshikimate 1-carboxyvinyltransferase
MKFEPEGPLHGDLHPPPDKSVSHRAALIGAMAEGPTRISGYLDSADTRATLRAVAAVGADVTEGEPDGNGGLFVEVEGIGLRGPRPAEIDVANAGTLLRLMPGWLAGRPMVNGLWTGRVDSPPPGRPDRGAASPDGSRRRGPRRPPATAARSRGALRGIDYELPVASAQVKSCVLLAGLLAEGTTTVHEPHWTRDHTERLLASAGAEIRRDGGNITVSRPSGWRRRRAGAGRLLLGRLLPGRGPDRAGKRARTPRGRHQPCPDRPALHPLPHGSRDGRRPPEAWASRGHDPRAARDHHRGDPRARSRADRTPHVGPPPEGAAITADDVPSAIDELPLVALLGCFADGETVVSGAAELRAKESDRIAGIVDGLTGLGAEIEGRPDGFAVRGTSGLRGGTLDARGDHRLAMVGAVAGLASGEGVEVTDFESVEVSYPGFERDLRSLLT